MRRLLLIAWILAIGLCFFSGMIYLGVILAVPLLFILLKIFVGGTIDAIVTPFRFLHKLFTKTLSGSAPYKNTAEVIIFGIFGNIAYVLFLFILFSFLIAYRPYNDGYICKASTYEAGDVVIVEMNDERYEATVESAWLEGDIRRCATVSVNGKSVEAVESVLDDYHASAFIKGLYITEDDNFFVQLAKSAWGFISNIFTRTIEMIKSE